MILRHQTNTHSLSVSHSALSYGKLFSEEVENKNLLYSLKDIKNSGPTYISLVPHKDMLFFHLVTFVPTVTSLSSQREKEILISPLFKVSLVYVYFKPQNNHLFNHHFVTKLKAEVRQTRYFTILTLQRVVVKALRGGVLVKALRYKPVGRAFDSRWCHWNFSVT